MVNNCGSLYYTHSFLLHIMQEIINKEEKMRNIFETAQKMKNGTIKAAKVYDSIDDFATKLKRV